MKPNCLTVLRAGFGKKVDVPIKISEVKELDPCACGSSLTYSDCCLKYHSDSSRPIESPVALVLHYLQ